MATEPSDGAAPRTLPTTSGDWEILPLERGPAAQVLGDAATALDAVPPHGARLRWYVATDGAIVLGRGQPVPPAPTPLPVLRRGTGGGAVLLDADLLSCDALLPAGHPLLEGDLGVVFERVGVRWSRALAELGVEDLAVSTTSSPARRLGTPHDRLRADVCYATVGRGEVTSGGRKLVGLAQRRRRQGAVVACGVLLRWRPGPLLQAFGADPTDREIAAAAVGLADLLDPVPSDDDIAEVVSRHLTADATTA